MTDTTSEKPGASGFDKKRSAAFLETMTGIMNGGALALMLLHRPQNRLARRNVDHDADATSEEIAEAAGLQERYVREWLAATDRGRRRRSRPGRRHATGLPPEHAGLLTRAAGPLNLTTYCQYVALSGRGRG